MTSQPTLILFTRYPEPGRTKTRMIPKLGAQGAADLQRQLTKHVVSTVKMFQQQYPASVAVYWSGGNQSAINSWLQTSWPCWRQTGETLGDRLLNALNRTFIGGADRVVIIGCDCPSLTPQHLTQAFQRLKSHELVFGPALDGGYYLVGLQRSIPELFQRIDWGTERVLQQSLRVAKQQNLSVASLEWLNDVDRPEDLWIWEQIQAHSH